MSLRILIAPSGFKESLGVQEVTDAIARGVARALPGAEIMRAPMVDGGEGFVAALVEATGGEVRHVVVTGPVGDPVQSWFGVLGGDERRTTVIEMAAAAGLRLVPRDCRNPMLTTSFGVGELVRAALDAGAERILLGCGDSGINDGGAGLAQALGARLFDADGCELGRGGGALVRLASIDVSTLDPRLEHVTIDAAVNWHNMLLGDRGVARVFGPQKGATPEQVEHLDAALGTYAWRIMTDLGIDVAAMPGAGASGGLGAGLVAFTGARLHPRYEIVMQYLAFDELLGDADLVITAEGCLDGQSPYGKITCEVGRRAQARGIPVIALAGTIGHGAHATSGHGINAYASIVKGPCDLAEAMDRADELIEDVAESTMRMISVGLSLRAKRRSPSRVIATAHRLSRTKQRTCGL